MTKRYILYLLRWQASTPVLYGVLLLLPSGIPLIATIIANLIGGLIFFWVDLIIFKKVADKKEQVRRLP